MICAFCRKELTDPESYWERNGKAWCKRECYVPKVDYFKKQKWFRKK